LLADEVVQVAPQQVRGGPLTPHQLQPSLIINLPCLSHTNETGAMTVLAMTVGAMTVVAMTVAASRRHVQEVCDMLHMSEDTIGR